MNNKIGGISLLAFLASLAGIVVSFLLLKEDVLSTAHTLFEYFPARYNVVPSSTWAGAIILGVFTSVLQVVATSVFMSNKFPWLTRLIGFVSFGLSCWFDNWTDIVFRSSNLTGDIQIATITTLAFYTVGSEVTQGLSWLIFFHSWRSAVSDLMWGSARFQAGISSVAAEWKRFKSAAQTKEEKDRGVAPAKPPAPAPTQSRPPEFPLQPKGHIPMPDASKYKPKTGVSGPPPKYHP